MRTFAIPILLLGIFTWPLAAQKEAQDAGPEETKKEKARPPRIPDAPFVPRRGMIQREKGEFWAGPPDEGRFAHILGLTLVSRERLQEKLAGWPDYQELSPEQQQRLAERIDQVRETARRQALDVAREFGLQVGPGQEDEFVRMYWSERVAMDQSLRKEFQEKRNKLEREAEDRILRKFPKGEAKP